jgi:hypothetical protein
MSYGPWDLRLKSIVECAFALPLFSGPTPESFSRANFLEFHIEAPPQPASGESSQKLAPGSAGYVEAPSPW